MNQPVEKKNNFSIIRLRKSRHRLKISVTLSKKKRSYKLSRHFLKTHLLIQFGFMTQNSTNLPVHESRWKIFSFVSKQPIFSDKTSTFSSNLSASEIDTSEFILFCMYEWMLCYGILIEKWFKMGKRSRKCLCMQNLTFPFPIWH